MFIYELLVVSFTIIAAVPSINSKRQEQFRTLTLLRLNCVMSNEISKEVSSCYNWKRTGWYPGSKVASASPCSPSDDRSENWTS